MEDLVESILDYIRADYTDYAIMLNGEWGSGKTYFWDHKIKPKIESMQLNGKRYTAIYMSLYGISNLEEISKKIFIETTQLMDKNLKKFMDASGVTNIPEYAKTGLDMANFFGVTQNGDRIDYKQFFSTDDKVLCFDDLERANVAEGVNLASLQIGAFRPPASQAKLNVRIAGAAMFIISAPKTVMFRNIGIVGQR